MVDLDATDDELVRLTAAGDKAAFTRLVARHQRRLLALVTRSLTNRAVAEDVVQDVFTRAWINAPTWNAREVGGASYAAWLSRVAVNLCIDNVRKRRPTAPIETIAEPADPTPTADVAMLKQDGGACPRGGRGASRTPEGRDLVDLRCGTFERGGGGGDEHVDRRLRASPGARATGAANIPAEWNRVMDTRAFEEGLDRYGADLGRWPNDLRAAARDLLGRSAEAEAALAAMAEVEAFLQTSPLETGSPADLTIPNDIAAAAMRHPQVRRMSPMARNARWAAAAAAALVLGVLVGNVRLETIDASPDQVVAGALEATGTVDVD